MKLRLGISTPLTQALQWWGLLAGPLVWSAQLVIGYGQTVANCSAGGRRWSLDHDVWQLTTMSVAAAVALSACVAAVVAFLASREASSEPPGGRVRFLAAGGIAASFLSLALILLSGLGGTFAFGCRQS